MKTRVNLYLEEFRPVKEILPLQLVLVSWLAVVLAVSFLNNSTADRFVKTQQAGKVLNDTYRKLKEQIANLENQQASRKQDAKLIEEVSELESELRAKQILLAELVGREKFKNNGFSLMMEDLAERNDSELWLNHIQIDENDVYLRGNTLKSDAVPRWVNGLKESEYFAGRSFAGVKLFRDLDDQLAFILSSEEIKQQSMDDLVANKRPGQQSTGGQR